MQQIITVGPDGTISGLQHKKGKGVDLRQFGEASIVRVSEIEWTETLQAWFIQIKDENVRRWMGQSAGIPRPVTVDTLRWREATGSTNYPKKAGLFPKVPEQHQNHWLGFEDYDDAVAAEIEFLNALRLKGVLTQVD